MMIIYWSICAPQSCLLAVWCDWVLTHSYKCRYTKTYTYTTTPHHVGGSSTQAKGTYILNSVYSDSFLDFLYYSFSCSTGYSQVNHIQLQVLNPWNQSLSQRSWQTLVVFNKFSWPEFILSNNTDILGGVHLQGWMSRTWSLPRYNAVSITHEENARITK